MAGVLDSLLEGFHPGELRDWHGRFRVGDVVRVKGSKRSEDGDQIVGRIQRFTDDGAKAIVAPEHGGAHIEATPAQIAFHDPMSASRSLKRRSNLDPKKPPEETRAETSSDREAIRQAKERRSGASRVREATLAVVLEGFTIPAAAPPETPAQSQARGAAQVAAAQKSLAAGWNATKHPRSRGGKFAYTTGGKRATRGRARKGSTSSPRTLNTGSKGTLVRSIQRTLNVPQDGVYGPQTKRAVARYQRQHGLQVDGVVGRQTLASMRGSTNARLVAPGPITSRQARLTHHRAAKPHKPPAPVRVAGGVVV